MAESEEGAGATHPDPFVARFQEVLRTGELLRFMEEFQAESDRAAAVLGAAYLSDALGRALRKQFVGGRDLKDSLLEPDRPLSSFSARIKVAGALGILVPDARHDLELIRKVRNDFAHKSVGFSFENDEVRVHCGKLRLFLPLNGVDAASLSARHRFNHSVIALSTLHMPLAELAEPLKSRITQTQ